uniref:GTP-binding protein 2-like n=1 Tax=Styela clava TaxID=7725 RepID=UPI001939F728|nr:GTP-binding protein 2-like [Styela clava]
MPETNCKETNTNDSIDPQKHFDCDIKSAIKSKHKKHNNIEVGESSTEKEMDVNLPPEEEEGNVEYKLKLLNPTAFRIEHLITQMKWRLQEGQGEAIYKIGVEDNGICAGLTSDEMKQTMETLNQMASRLGADLSVLREREVDCEALGERKTIAEVLVRKVLDPHQFLDLRVSVLGNADAGKSTLLGVLTQGQLDNGRGEARLNLFRHLHEIQTGRTSCISHEILGFSSKGEVNQFNESRTAEDICENASKIVTFIDLAGHHKYLRTTVFGLTSHFPDFAMLVISANRGIVGTTREHLGFALALGVPTFAVVTKTDLCPPFVVDRACKQLERLLTSPGSGKIPFQVNTEDDAYTVAQNMIGDKSKVVPIFRVSSVSGDGLELLKRFLNVLPPQKNAREQAKLMEKPTEFQVDQFFSVPDVGPVVAGSMLRGTIKEDEELLMGPTTTGQFKPVTITSIRRNRAPCRVAKAGQGASLSLDGMTKDSIRKGMVIISSDVEPRCYAAFDATVCLLYHPMSQLQKGFQTTVHVGSVCRTAIIETIHNDKESISTNEQATVTFRFFSAPEYLRIGSTLIFREQATKGIGQITKLHSYDSEQPNLAVFRRKSMSVSPPASPFHLNSGISGAMLLSPGCQASLM